ncbi:MULTISPECIES: SURF1 family protein [unclassified Undibacterium]|uniref:SURF1 family protein n=1 Tax=unclassified Undibacterium TaxID=2630295 RepID=UPI002AC9B832|nr:MULTISPECIES: SURF1 family protein [unclassified Undibacterium]MEB0139031.1 SURF1 family protein [Undibacterium sp. CCC2.1]MEB0171874.1 SURF1 family protein [Undibacterium sp. CCC1.1]MEB0175815.1 SURF1 family protein [Undibacterium sp. CCC3.4]MEB0215119.1 SURF1 family protein [Undibacterium sp. 5I2]WPX45086.1 SURF1 family protein [Undibacterium sp. CCC3.4]
MLILSRFKLIPLLVSIALVVLGISLAQWQTRRALEKEQIAAAIVERSRLPAVDLASVEVASLPLWSKVSLRGEFVSNWPLYLDNRPMQGKAGLIVLMPFKLAGSQRSIVVARGWQARNLQDRMQTGSLLTPSGVVTITGILRARPDRVLQLGQAAALVPGALLQNLDIADLASHSGLELAALIVEQHSSLPDQLQRDWPVPAAGADKHRAYAFQWYALALMACLFFIFTGIRRGKNQSASAVPPNSDE